MNTESINLSMTASEADKVAYVLMSALHKVSMLPSERKVATEAANTLFDLLGYRTRCGSYGERIELGDDGQPVKMACEHPGVFAAHDAEQEMFCPSCSKMIPIAQL